MDDERSFSRTAECDVAYADDWKRSPFRLEYSLPVQAVLNPAPYPVKKGKDEEKKFHLLGNIHHSIFSFKMSLPEYEFWTERPEAEKTEAEFFMR